MFAAPNVIVTVLVLVISLGDEIVAVKLREPTKPVSFTPLPTKLATPALAFIVTVPPIVELLEDNVTDWLASDPVVTVLPSWS